MTVLILLRQEEGVAAAAGRRMVKLTCRRTQVS